MSKKTKQVIGFGFDSPAFQQLLRDGQEKLCPELRCCLVERDTFTLLSHPLVHTFYNPGFNGQYNRQLVQKREAIREAIAEKKWESVLVFHERPYRKDAFVQYCNRMTTSEYWKHLAWIWTDSESIHHDREGWEKLLLNPKRISERQHMMDEEEQELLTAMPGELVVYHGIETDEGDIGMSWTLDPKIARWFAHRFGGSRPVMVGTLNKDQTIAYLTHRNEEEIICDPLAVRGVKVLEG